MPQTAGSMSQQDIAALCDRVRAGDRAAADTIINSQTGLVWRELERINRRCDDELIQEGRLALWSAAKTFRAERGCRWATWAVPIVRQHVAKALRRRGRKRADTEPLPPDPPGREPGDAPESPCPAELDRLDAGARAVLLLVHGGRKRRSFAEVAALLGSSADRVRLAYRAAVEALRASPPPPPP